MTKSNQQNQQQQSSKKDKKKKGNSQSQPRGLQKSTAALSPCERQYLISLNDSQDPRASGTCVPDLYPFPTTRREGKIKIIVTTNSSGNFLHWHFPSPTLSTWTDHFNGSYSCDGVTINTTYGNTTALTFTSDNNLVGQFNSFRTVSSDHRYQNLQNFSQVTGVITVTPFICKGWAPLNQTTFASINSDNPITVVTNANKQPSISLPGSYEVTADQLIKNELLLSHRPAGPRATAWRALSNTSPLIGSSTGGLSGEETYSNTTGLITTHNINEANLFDDWIGFAVYGSGFPASTNVMEIVSTINVEGMEVSSTSNYLLPSGMIRERERTHSVGWEEVAQMAAPMIRMAAPVLTGMISGPRSKKFLKSLVDNM